MTKRHMSIQQSTKAYELLIHSLAFTTPLSAPLSVVRESLLQSTPTQQTGVRHCKIVSTAAGKKTRAIVLTERVRNGLVVATLAWQKTVLHLQFRTIYLLVYKA